MSRKVRVAVIGCGSIAKHRHIPEYVKNTDAELVAFCDVVRERAESFAKIYGAEAYTNYDDLLAHAEFDAISVCTANVLHAPISIKALERGKHVLCEKPMAVSHEEAEEMIQAAEKAHVVLMIGHNQRLMPAHQKAKQILSQGSLGKVISFRTTFAHGGPEQWSVEGVGGWFFQKKQAFIGALGDLGVHKIDLIRWLLEDEIVEVGAFIGTLEKPATDVDDNTVCLLRTASGAIGTMTASWTHHPGEDNSTILYCERGIMKIGTDPIDQVIVERLDGCKERYQVGAIATNETGGQTDSGVIHAFISSIISGQPPLITGEDGKRALQVVLAAIQSSEERRFVSVQHDLADDLSGSDRE